MYLECVCVSCTVVILGMSQCSVAGPGPIHMSETSDYQDICTAMVGKLSQCTAITPVTLYNFGKQANCGRQ